MSGKHNNLGGFWKPDKQTLDAERKSRAKRNERTRKSRLTAKQRRKIRRLAKRAGYKLTNKKARKTCGLPNRAFFKTKVWRFLRFKVLNTYGRRCMCCGEVDVELHVDHIKPRSKYPELSLEFDNLQVLCKDCNMNKSNIHETDYRDKAAGEALDIELVAQARAIGL